MQSGRALMEITDSDGLVGNQLRNCTPVVFMMHSLWQTTAWLGRYSQLDQEAFSRHAG
jgi:hypothetical protein